MRKLKLQMQQTVNGYVAGPNGELGWMTWNWSDDIKQCVTDITDSIDTILLGRKMTDGFISHWDAAAKNPDDPSQEFAKKMVNTHKVVFTKTLERSVWENTVLAKGDVADEVNKLKTQKGKDIVVYGGAGFVSSLIKENLIDELYLFVNPSAIAAGLTIFGEVGGQLNLKLNESKAFDCGIVLLNYSPA
jgi:dihydrofolate reductase